MRLTYVYIYIRSCLSVILWILIYIIIEVKLCFASVYIKKPDSHGDDKKKKIETQRENCILIFFAKNIMEDHNYNILESNGGEENGSSNKVILSYPLHIQFWWSSS